MNELQENFVMKCPLCKNPLPEHRTTSYVTDDGLTEFYEYICAFCKTKVLMPFSAVEAYPNQAM